MERKNHDGQTRLYETVTSASSALGYLPFSWDLRCNYEHTLIHQLHQVCAIGKRGKYCRTLASRGFDMEVER